MFYVSYLYVGNYSINVYNEKQKEKNPNLPYVFFSDMSMGKIYMLCYQNIHKSNTFSVQVYNELSYVHVQKRQLSTLYMYMYGQCTLYRAV